MGKTAEEIAKLTGGKIESVKNVMKRINDARPEFSKRSQCKLCQYAIPAAGNQVKCGYFLRTGKVRETQIMHCRKWEEEQGG